MAPVRRIRRSLWQGLRDFYWKAYHDNLTGLSAMVAYNLLASIFPLALLALFIAGKILQSGSLEASVLKDLRHLFPNIKEQDLNSLLNSVRRSSAGLGIGALVTSIWIGSSFWGALDTAFCRIYHVRCRTWVEQKRFALVMLVVVLLFMAATVLVPTLQSILIGGAENLPFGLSTVHTLIFVVSLIAGLLILFAILCVIYWSVPNRLVPWRAIWPGALAATLAIGAIDNAFPAYLTNISSIARIRASLILLIIILIWFYAVAIIMLGGAVINAARFEIHDTGELKVEK
ncbi:MAG TPA: YihY/virulence factor BrkB family protein [Thermoleophilaceae bacterium]